ncbi:MAG: Na(+)-translocating NADH-quinone reductase subunit A [Pseudomonadales bacterium]
MAHRIRIKKGLDIPISGTPEPTVGPGQHVRSVALLGGDYLGLKPKMLVQEGDQVSLGQALFIDKRDPDVMFTAPGSGRVVAINRGARRVLQSVVIELDESETDTSEYMQLAGSDPETIDKNSIRSALLTSGLWTAFRTRPYSKVPQSNSNPNSIFVTAIDTQPLAADPKSVLNIHREAFLIGLETITRLTEGTIYMCTEADWNGPLSDNQQVQHVEFSGPHPAGMPGTHIHHLHPVSADRTVWHIGYQDVIAIGKLFTEGHLWLERIISLGGKGFERPRLVTTRLGVSINELVVDELIAVGAEQKSPRLISGSVLNGRTAVGAEAYLGRHHLQVSAIPQNSVGNLFGWSGFFNRHYSFSGILKRQQNHTHEYPFSTALNGRSTALVPVDAFEHIMPLDILPVPLLRALLIKNTDQAQALGCLELDAEDLALCSFVCPSKNDYGAVLRINLEQIERDG